LNKDSKANAFLPLYPVFKDLVVHHMLNEDLRIIIDGDKKHDRAEKIKL
jgi:hypothetical protein